MGTKNNPGSFDCYANAGPDEPMFILLGRDKHAPTLVWLWATLRELDGEDPAKVAEARECTISMLRWQKENGRSSIGIGQAALAGVMELVRAANMGVKNAPNASTNEEVVRLYLSATNFDPEVPQEARVGLPDEPWTRADERASDLLSLVGYEAPATVIATWSDEQVKLAEEWAGATHLHASDNDEVVVPPRPDFLPEPWAGPWHGEGVMATNPTPITAAA